MGVLTEMDRKLLRFAAYTKAVDEDAGIVTAIVNTTGITDLQGDFMAPGCFRKCVAEGQRPAICWQHDTKQILGHVVSMQELMPGDGRLKALPGPKAGQQTGGLLVNAQFNMKTQAGHDAFYHVKAGDISEWSIQFNHEKGDEERNLRDGTRVVKLVNEIFEASPVLKGASPFTATLSAKRQWPLGSGESADAAYRLAHDRAYDATYLAIQEREREEAHERNRKAVLRERIEVAAQSLVRQLDRAAEIREIERLTNQTGNYWQVKAARPLTQEEERIRAIEKMAGIYGCHFQSAPTQPQSRPFTGMI